jgi:methylated-DNA-[protein]-cysteine S-methyltransferase
VTTISFGTLESEFGTLTLALSARGLVRLALPTEPTSQVVEGLERRYGTDLLEGGSELDAARRTVEAYLAGHNESLDVPVDWSIAHGFTLSSLQRLAEVPYGTTVTYRELAARAGNERAPRAAGAACATNPVAIVVPCHRVLRSDGGLGGFGGGLEMKEALLRLEGVRL